MNKNAAVYRQYAAGDPITIDGTTGTIIAKQPFKIIVLFPKGVRKEFDVDGLAMYHVVSPVAPTSSEVEETTKALATCCQERYLLDSILRKLHDSWPAEYTGQEVLRSCMEELKK